MSAGTCATCGRSSAASPSRPSSRSSSSSWRPFADATGRRTGEPCGGGATWLAAAVVGLGIFALVAFDTLFAVFHEVLFPAGSYDFDPATERLVQLFPFQFWQETAIAVGIVIIAISALVAVVAHRRERRPATRAAADPAAEPIAEPG